MTLSGDLPERFGTFHPPEDGAFYHKACQTSVQSHHDRELTKQGIILRVTTDSLQPDGSIRDCTCHYCQEARYEAELDALDAEKTPKTPPPP